MGVKPRKILKVISGWEAVELFCHCALFGLWQLFKISFKWLWKGHRRKSYTHDFPPVELTVDSSVGTHCYIKILGVKYHYVEAGPKSGDVILVLGDAPDPGLLWTPMWISIVQKLIDSDHRVITLDLRGSGGSEGGNRVDLSPPRVVEELFLILKALGVSDNRPATIIGQGIGGMLGWYLAHCHGPVLSKLVVIDAPHPSLYWQYPPAEFCQNVLHFIQWPWLPEQWLSQRAVGEGSQWANSRAQDWAGALNYVRGAAWWRVDRESRVAPPTLLISQRAAAAQLVASGERCAAPTLRLLPNEAQVADTILHYLVVQPNGDEAKGSLVHRMLGAVAGRGRELSARLMPPARP